MGFVYYALDRAERPPSQHDWLSPEERGVMADFSFVKRRADWRLGRWTAKCLLQRTVAPAAPLAAIEIRAAPDGAPEPYLKGLPLPVGLSISHSHGVGAAVVHLANRRVGCDLERIEARRSSFMALYFSEGEREALLARGPEEQAAGLTLLWSAKESALKTMRTGLRIDTRRLTVDFPSPLRWEGEGWQRLSVTDLEAPERRFSGWFRRVGGFILTVTVSEKCSSASKR